ncbi:hypothetical protein YC2023_059608 [Brassica napus]
MLSDLFEIHIVSSEISVGVSTDFAGLMGCSATSSSSTGSFAVQTYLLGLFNVDSDYFLLAAVSIVSKVQVKSFQRFLYFEQVSLCNISILCVIVRHLLLVTLSEYTSICGKKKESGQLNSRNFALANVRYYVTHKAICFKFRI